MNGKETEQSYVFGLDIGTRNVVGTVGYRTENEFIVVAQCMMEQEARAMVDGQIHDIARVGRTIAKVKEKLEQQTGVVLTDVCIAAAGRVLKTVTTEVSYEFPEETVVKKEDVHTLDLLGIEKAQGILGEQNDTKYKFYCVGYSTVRYYLNDEEFSNLEGHKADVIREEIIVTFLPEDVVDGLYSAVAQAGLAVANMTLEPIAAINVAIPETFRMLNIALVDVGAGTSDISVTKDGSIIAYGMIPLAGDELTDLIVQNYLVDFKTAEEIKIASGTQETITYRDIMLLEHTVSAKEVWDLTEPVVDKMTTEVAEKIKELNGDKSVSATFVVGGGGKIHSYTEMLAEKLGIVKERVALRGEEVLGQVTFQQQDIKKDPLLVTPIGICLNYYDQKNSFIMVHLNGERIKLYDNNKLLIMDAAMQAGIINEDLFPKRGKEIHYTQDGVAKLARGEAGESAVITMNGKTAGINTPLEPNSQIRITPSTRGADAKLTIAQLDGYHSSPLTFFVNGAKISCPRFVEVNGKLEPASYEVKDGDVIETRAYYTVAQIAEFMDVELDTEKGVFVNNRAAEMDDLVYENFNIEWETLSFAAAEPEKKNAADGRQSENGADGRDVQQTARNAAAGQSADAMQGVSAARSALAGGGDAQPIAQNAAAGGNAQGARPGDGKNAQTVAQTTPSRTLQISVNGATVLLTGKPSYTFVDIFDYYPFDLSASAGRGIITKLNDESAHFTAELKDGDRIELAWKEK